jgi:hypothetical protein
MPETLLSPSSIFLFGLVVTDLAIIKTSHYPFTKGKLGNNDQLGEQLNAENDPKFARIYGFSYQGTYYDLPSPTVFLVHGDGDDAAEAKLATGKHRARAPGEPSLTGVAAAEFQFADDLRVWSYDRSDYTIRLDIDTGMFEDMLLDPFFGGDGGGGVSGARVSGARVSGARVSGARVSGARVSGARLSGGRGDATD